MVSSSAQTVEEYLRQLPPERREIIGKVRKVILKNLPKGYEEMMLWGMISYIIPLSRYPNTYNNQPLGVAALAAQKHYYSLYLLAVYGHPETERWFKTEYAKRGKKLDIGKSCVRFKSLDDLPVDLIGEVIRKVSVDDYIKLYEQSRRDQKAA